MSSAQVGKTEVISNILGYHIHQDPSPVLLLQPTLEMAQTYSKDRLAPMVRDTPELRDRVQDAKSRDSKNTILHKGFPGGHITMAGANSPASLASRPIRLVLCDEVDRYPISAGTEGDPVGLARKRAATFWNRRIVLTSTPTIRGQSRIEQAYEESDKRQFLVKCPECSHKTPIVWANILFDKKDPETAHWGCPECGCIVEGKDKARFVKNGEWVATGESRGVAGFHLNELISPWVPWSETVDAFLKAKHISDTGDHSQMQVWVNTALGETWEEVGVSVDPMGLYQRREDWTGVPDGVSFLTIGADCQDNRVEWEVVGWGKGEESWSIDYQVLFGDPTKAEFWQKVARGMKQGYKRADGCLFVPKMAFIDSGGHYTDEVYEFSRVHGQRFFIPVKGSSIKGKPIADYPRKLNKKRVALTMIGTDTAKDVIFSRLELQDKGAGYCHFNQDRNTDYFQQLTAEKKIMRYVKGFPVYDYVLATGTRNEALDCRVYAFAAARTLQQYFGQALDIPDKVVKNPTQTQDKGLNRFQRTTSGGFDRR